MNATRQLVNAGSLLRCALTGDIVPGTDAVTGLFLSDVRVISLLRLTVDGRPCSAASESRLPGSRTVVLIPDLARHETSSVAITRTQSIDAGGFSDQLTIDNVTTAPTTTSISLDIASDFADPFMLRSDRLVFDRGSATHSWSVEPTPAGARIVAAYRRERGERSFAIELSITVTGQPAVEICSEPGETASGVSLRWDLQLAAGERQTVALSARVADAPPIARLTRGASATASPELGALRGQALDDIESLRMPFASGGETGAGGIRSAENGPDESDVTIVAAGAPWFLTLFGRDSLITSLLAEADLPGLADGNLRALRATQATSTDATRSAQPGKILHELRSSELAQLREVPYDRYYGSVDATPLFLTALATLGSTGLQRDSEAAARAAIDWMMGPGGLSESGFLRYVPDPHGLITQGWKDSADSVAHRDGRIADGAIALCEVQGYAWRALRDSARMAREIWNDEAFASRLEATASELKARFHERFWMADGEFPALALDGADERVEVVGSNAGHLLYSGILDRPEAERVTARLLDGDMFTGWGIRTLSSREARFNPLAYHNGAVWPHDSMLAALGMAAYGMRDEAKIVARGIVDAAAHFDNRPPELFGGFDRADYPQPVAYARAATPQAWASAAMLAAVRILSNAVPQWREGE